MIEKSTNLLSHKLLNKKQIQNGFLKTGLFQNENFGKKFDFKNGFLENPFWICFYFNSLCDSKFVDFAYKYVVCK